MALLTTSVIGCRQPAIHPACPHWGSGRDKPIGFSRGWLTRSYAMVYSGILARLLVVVSSLTNGSLAFVGLLPKCGSLTICGLLHLCGSLIFLWFARLLWLSIRHLPRVYEAIMSQHSNRIRAGYWQALSFTPREPQARKKQLYHLA